MTQPSLLVDSGATFSPCGKYRQLLWRRWANGPQLAMIMLNPSKAGEVENDPTVARQITRAQMMGMGGLLVANAFDFVATDPADMKRQPKPSSQWNDLAILEGARGAVESGGLVICAWGKHGAHMGRSVAVRKLLAGIPLYALKITTGEPHHPLYIGYDVKPFLWVVVE